MRIYFNKIGDKKMTEDRIDKLEKMMKVKKIVTFFTILLLLAITFSFLFGVRLVTGSVKFSTGSIPIAQVEFELPPNENVILTTGGSMKSMDNIILYELPNEGTSLGKIKIAEISKGDSFSFTTSSKGNYYIYVSGTTGTFRFNIYQEELYTPVLWIMFGIAFVVLIEIFIIIRGKIRYSL